MTTQDENRPRNSEALPPSTLEDDEYYRQCFTVFLKTLSYTSSTTREEWHSDIVGKILLWIEQSVANCDQQVGSQTLRSMGVGGGDGVIETTLLSQTLSKLQAMVYHRVVEPNEILISLYQRHVSVEDNDFKTVTFDWRQETIEEYYNRSEDEHDHTKFHFISTVHSAYYFQDIEASLGYLYSQLETGGILLVIMTVTDSGVAKIAGMNTALECFKAKGIPYETYRLGQIGDISGCMANTEDEMTEEKSLLLDFYTNVRGFMKSSLSPDLKESILAKMRSTAVVSADGKMSIDQSEMALVVRHQ